MRVLCVAFCAVVFWNLFCCEAPPADCIDYGAYLHWEGRVTTAGHALDVVVRDDYAYVACGFWGAPGFQIYDISEPGSPCLVGSAFTIAWPFDVAVSGETAYLAEKNYSYPYDGAFEVVDISDPADPRVIARLSTPGAAEAVAVEDCHAYLAEDHWFQIIDIRNPKAPQVVSSLDLPGPAGGVAIHDGHACVTAGPSLQIIDVLDPSSPVIVGSVGLQRFARRVAVAQSYAYVTDDVYLSVIDVSDPSRPEIVGSLQVSPNDVSVEEPHAFMATHSGFCVADVEDPQHPRIVATMETSGNAFGVAVGGDYAFIACCPDEHFGYLEVFDIRGPISPEAVGEASVAPDAQDVTVWEDHACIVGASRSFPLNGIVEVVSVADPQLPVSQGVIDVTRVCHAVAARGTVAYAGGEGIVYVVDLEDPANPHVIRSVYLPGLARRIALAGSCAYAACDQAGLVVIDISEPSTAYVLSSVTTGGTAYGVAVSDTHAYLIDDDPSILWVIDITTPESPQIRGSVSIPHPDPMAVAVAGAYVYVGGLEALWVVEVSNPDNPHVVGSLSSPGLRWIADIDVLDGSVYVAGRFGIRVIDVHDPVFPRLLGSVHAGGARAVCLSGGLAHTAGTGTFTVLPIQCEAAHVVVDLEPWQAITALEICPNPASSETAIRFHMQVAGGLRAAIYDVQGREVLRLYEGQSPAGPVELLWKGRNACGVAVPVGIYLARIRTTHGTAAARFALVRSSVGGD